MRQLLPGWIAAETVVRRFGDSGDVVWLDAGAASDLAGGLPLAGHPTTTLVGWGDRRILAHASTQGAIAGALRDLDTALSAGASGAEAPLGWWGLVGYGVAAELLAPGDPAWAAALADDTHPDLALLEVDRALVFDHVRGTVELVTRGDHADWVEALIGWWNGGPVAAALDPALGSVDTARPADPVWHDDDAGYVALVDRCRAAIHEGDAFVLCLTTAVSVPTVAVDLDLYARLRRHSPAPRASFVRIGELALIGASPESFLQIDTDGRVSTSPIKGTRIRDSDPEVDAESAAELRGNAKERAENLMIVDLMRNDLGRVCEAGSVEVPELFAVHSYEHVHQLVSTVTGRVRQGLSGVDVLRATFPPGSMTGAPKHSSVALLQSFEGHPRGVYSGVVGRFGYDGTTDLAVVIRSIALDLASGAARVGVGAGITEGSVPTDELTEVHAKAAPLLQVLGAASR